MNLEWVFELGVQRLETLEEQDWHSPVSSGHSNHPGALMHYLGLLEFPVRICDASHITTRTRPT